MKKSLFFVAACAVTFSTTVQAKSSDLVKHWAGCYAIHILRALYVPPLPAEAKAYQDIPIGLKLMTAQRDGSTVALMGYDVGLNDQWPFKGWELKPDGGVMVDWGTGFVGYHVQLKETESRITGTIEYHTDTDSPGSFPKWEIEARRVSCETGRRKTK